MDSDSSHYVPDNHNAHINTRKFEKELNELFGTLRGNELDEANLWPGIYENIISSGKTGRSWGQVLNRDLHVFWGVNLCLLRDVRKGKYLSKIKLTLARITSRADSSSAARCHPKFNQHSAYLFGLLVYSTEQRGDYRVSVPSPGDRAVLFHHVPQVV